LKIISIEDLIAYRLKQESIIEKEVDVKLPTDYGDFRLHAYRQKTNEQEHLALSKGSWKKDEPLLVRVHSSCLTGDIFGSCRCDCGHQLHKAMEMIEKEGKGVIVYMNQEGRGIGLLNKLKAYKLQEEGYDTVDANVQLGFQPDERDYGVGAQILRDLGVSKLRLLSNNPKKRAGLIGYGLEIVEVIPLEIQSNKHNELYLDAKRDKLGHEIRLKKGKE
jgi:3,4-dihydroxy 2-butanone 4-phosphate synthase/GTP cyclohydrolase II